MLKELYHGEISPSERKAEPDDRLTQKWLKLSAEFEKTLTAEQIDMFHKLSDMQGENSARDNEVLYIQGFRDGAVLMMEILSK